jgi:hypothetical protein
MLPATEPIAEIRRRMTISPPSFLLAAFLAQQPSSVLTTPPRNELEQLLLASSDDQIGRVQIWVDAHADDPEELQRALSQAGFGPRFNHEDCWFRRYERIVKTDGARITANIRFCDDQKPTAFVMFGYPYPSRAPLPGERSDIMVPKTK